MPGVRKKLFARHRSAALLFNSDGQLRAARAKAVRNILQVAQGCPAADGKFTPLLLIS